jgi:hypothetical protein
MKTAIYTPNFYLARKGFVIKITTKTLIGRTQGDVILEDDELLSSLHCEINPRLLEVFIKDLDSTNGVFVNKQKIFPNTDVRLNAGDLIKIGKDEYTLCDNEKAVRKIDPPADRRKHRRAENLYSYKNLWNFYSAHTLFRVVYYLAILAATASLFLNVHIEIPVPQELDILSKLYADQIVLSGLKIIFMVFAISLVHSLGLHLYFNRNPMRKGISLAVYLILLFLLVDFRNGPLWGVKQYILERQAIENFKPQKRAIVQLKEIVKHQEKLRSGYRFTLGLLHSDQQKILKDDFKKLEDQVMKEINKINMAKKT